MVERLKKKWGVEGNLQFLLILFVFSASGSGVLFVRRAVFHWLGFTAQTPMWIKAPMWLLIIFPSYQVILLLLGTLCGQHRFFWNFQKRMWGRMFRSRRAEPASVPAA